MNMTNEQFEAIEKALRLLPQGDAFNALSPDEQATIVNADKAMVDLLKKRKRNNKRTAEYIAEKRKSDPNYARSRKE